MNSKFFKPEKVIFIIDEDGIYTSNPKKNKNAKLLKQVKSSDLNRLSTGLNNHADVTKGMEGKIDIINKIAQLGLDTYLLNGNKYGRLYGALVEKKIISTIVKGDNNESN